MSEESEIRRAWKPYYADVGAFRLYRLQQIKRQYFNAVWKVRQAYHILAKENSLLHGDARQMTVDIAQKIDSFVGRMIRLESEMEEFFYSEEWHNQTHTAKALKAKKDLPF